MEVRKTLNSAIVATSAMTAFSYLASWLIKQNFKEPKLLGDMLEPTLPHRAKALSTPGGWAAHYCFGLTWSLMLIEYIKAANIKNSAENGLIIGSVGGLTAIACWKFLFDSHPCPPKTHRRNFYAQLFLAHLIFTGTLMATNRKG